MITAKKEQARKRISFGLKTTGGSQEQDHLTNWKNYRKDPSILYI